LSEENTPDNGKLPVFIRPSGKNARGSNPAEGKAVYRLNPVHHIPYAFFIKLLFVKIGGHYR